MKSGKIEVKSSLVSVQFEFSNRKTNCSEVKCQRWKWKKAIDVIFDGNHSDHSGLSSDEEQNDEIEDAIHGATFLTTNQLMLQNLTMTFILLL